MWVSFVSSQSTLKPRQNGRHFADDVFKCIFLNENVWILLKISLKFVPKGPINNIPSLIQMMAWRRPDDKPLSEPMMVSLLTHICVTRPQWVKDIMVFWYLTMNYSRLEKPLQWRHNECNGVSYHRRLPCLLNLLFMRQRKHQTSTSLDFERGIHQWPVDSTQKRPVTRRCFNLMTSSWINWLTSAGSGSWSNTTIYIDGLVQNWSIQLMTGEPRPRYSALQLLGASGACGWGRGLSCSRCQVASWVVKRST